MSEQRGVGTRLFVVGGREVRQDFDQVGNSGKRMWAEIASGQRSANPALRGLSGIASEAKEGVAGLAAEAGAAGRALGVFGAAGIAVAAALGGAMLAVGQARNAMRIGDAISDDAEKIGIGTDKLQEYRYAVQQTGGDAADADAAITAFQKKLGEAAGGLSERAMRPFKALGFTQEELRGFKSVDEALVAVTDRVAALSSEAERAAVAEKLGLSPMIGLLRQGSDRMNELRQAAHDLGYVMDEDVIRRMGEANDKFEAAATIIRNQFAAAFVDLVPVLVSVMEQIAGIARETNNFLESFKQVEERSARAIWDKIKERSDDIERLRNGSPLPGVLKDAYIKSALADIAEMNAELQRRGATAAPAGSGRPLVRLEPTGRTSRPKKPELTPLSEGDLLTPYLPDGSKVPNRSWEDWWAEETFGPKIPRATLELDADVSTLDDAVRPWLDRTEDAVRDSFRSGVEAAFSGDLLDWLKVRLMDGLFNGIADGLTGLWKQATQGGMGSGGGLGGWLMAGANALLGGGGRNAVGGYDWTGLNSKAEYGPELGVFGRPGQVFSHDDTLRLLQQAGGGGGPRQTFSFSYAPVYNVQGSGPEIDRLRADMRQDRESFSARVVGVVNDARERMQIR